MCAGEGDGAQAGRRVTAAEGSDHHLGRKVRREHSNFQRRGGGKYRKALPQRRRCARWP